MLEHLPRWVGSLLRNVRAGHSQLVIVQSDLGIGDEVIDLSSPAFAHGGRLPPRFTADGEGVSPPLVWGEVPPGTRSLVLIVEDPDAPALHPLVHALLWNLPADERRLAEGAITRELETDHGPDVGRNSLFGEGWLPPDPPAGHGSHDYVFQLFALDDVLDIGANPGRSGLARAMAGRVLAAGMLIGIYSRGEDSPIVQQGMPSVAPA